MKAWLGRGMRPARPAERSPGARKPIGLALQGGGSWGAYTWGVLDALLAGRTVTITQLSGTSAGAINAAIVASALAKGSPSDARRALSSFWVAMSDPTLSNLARELWRPVEHKWRDSLGAWLWSTGMLSPYSANPLGLNPLREALLESIDFERLRNRSPIKLLLAATRVTDGRLRILTNPELTVEAVLASACLPLLNQSIVIDGEAYWDGGYAANPPLIPLVRASKSDHLLIVQVTPMKTNRLPVTAPDITKRIDQIQFNATLNSELEALKLGKLIGASAKLRRLRIGRISVDEEVEGLAQESAGNLGSEFLERLRASGHVAADLWLKKDMPQASRQPQEPAL